MCTAPAYEEMYLLPTKGIFTNHSVVISTYIKDYTVAAITEKVCRIKRLFYIFRYRQSASFTFCIHSSNETLPGACCLT